jgi:hypothetical protein
MENNKDSKVLFDLIEVRKKQWEKMKKNRENWIERGENEMIITI